MNISKVRAWDWPTRAFHWALVLGIVSAWGSFRFADQLGDPMLVYHRWNGYVVLTLIVFRMIWGFAGSSTSRFTAFVRGPASVLSYARGLARGGSVAYLGHNPMGAAMIVALLLAVATQGTLGLFSLEHNELVAGPLKRLVSHDTSVAITKLHILGFNVILALVAVHITANVLYGLIKKEPLVSAMITGEKPAGPYADQQEAVLASHVTVRAVITLAVAAVIVFGGITALGGRLV